MLTLTTTLRRRGLAETSQTSTERRIQRCRALPPSALSPARSLPALPACPARGADEHGAGALHNPKGEPMAKKAKQEKKEKQEKKAKKGKAF